MSTKPKLVAIVGGSGSGKTWLAHELVRRLDGAAARVSLDDFYRDRSALPLSRRANCNFDQPRAIDWAGVREFVAACKNGEPARLPDYDFSTHSRRTEPRAWEPKPIVIFDGLWLLRGASMRKSFAMRLFVECEESVRFGRRLERDTRERGRSSESVREQFFGTVAPMHNLHVAPQSVWADQIIPSPIPEPVLRNLTEELRSWLDD